MHWSLIVLAGFLGFAIADEWNSFGDNDDDSLYRYRPTGLLQGGGIRYPSYRRYNRGSNFLNTGSGYRRNSLYGGYAGYGSYGNGYGTSWTSGSLGTSYRPYTGRGYYSRRSSFRRPSVGSRRTFRINSFDDDDDFDDLASGVLGTSSIRRSRGRSIRPSYRYYSNYRNTNGIGSFANYKPSPIHIGDSFDDNDDGIRRGILGSAGSSGSRTAIRPIANKAYNKKLRSITTTGNVGRSTFPLTFDDNGDDFGTDDGVLGIRGAGSRGTIRPVRNGGTTGSLGVSTIPLRRSFDDKGDDFDSDNGILGTAIAQPSLTGQRTLPISSGGVGGQQPRRIGSVPSLNRGILGPAVNGVQRPSFRKKDDDKFDHKDDRYDEKDYDDHNRHGKSYQHNHLHLHGYKPSYDDDFGSAPVFSQSYSGQLGGQYSNNGYNQYGNGYYGGFGGTGGWSAGGVGGGFGGGSTGGGFGRGGHSHGGSGGESVEFDDFGDFDDESGSRGAGSSRGRRGGRFGGLRGVASRFVGGTFGGVGGAGSFGGVGGHGGHNSGYNGYAGYPKSYKNTKSY